MAKIAFIQSEVREFFSYMLMSANLKKAGHEVDVFVVQNDQIWFPITYVPDIIGFSSTTISFNEDLKICKRIKTKYPKAFIIFGGAHPTYNPEEVIKYDCIDAICIGEGLDAIVELADKINYTSSHDIRGFSIKNLWLKYCDKPLNIWSIIKNPIRPISNINDWPRPDYGLYYEKYPELRNKPTKPMYIVRGCPYKCAFCYNPSYNEMHHGEGKIFQCMDVDKAISEIKWLKDTYGFKRLQFMSDNMTINKKWLKEFMEKYAGKDKTVIGIYKGRKKCFVNGIIGFTSKKVMSEYGRYSIVAECGEDIDSGAVVSIGNDNKLYNYKDTTIKKPFLMNCRANEVTKEIVDILKDSGCARVDFGVEHGNDYIRNEILKRNMSKEQIINCGKWFKEAGIEIQTTNIFGLPHEDFNKAWESVELNRHFTPDMSKACILQPFKNTEIYNYAKKNNLLKDNMEYSGTVIQVGVKDNRSEDSKIKVKDEYQILNLSRLFDLLVKWHWIPKWLGYIICSLPLKKLYKKYYAYLLKKQTKKYK
jgi:radical SAM superfamily enzyme YgiQ (UPF0313 family)